MRLILLKTVTLKDDVSLLLCTGGTFVDKLAGVFARLNDVLAKIVEAATLELTVRTLVRLLSSMPEHMSPKMSLDASPEVTLIAREPFNAPTDVTSSLAELLFVYMRFEVSTEKSEREKTRDGDRVSVRERERANCARPYLKSQTRLGGKFQWRRLCPGTNC